MDTNNGYKQWIQTMDTNNGYKLRKRRDSTSKNGECKMQNTAEDHQCKLQYEIWRYT